MSFSIFYGINENKVDVTEICKNKLIFRNSITIPKGDINRSRHFNDHLVGIEKKYLY